MMEYQKVIKLIAIIEKASNTDGLTTEQQVEFYNQWLAMQTLAVAMEQRSNLNDIAKQIADGFARLDQTLTETGLSDLQNLAIIAKAAIATNEKFDAYIAERIESDKVVTRLLEEINIYSPYKEQESRTMSEKDKSGDGVPAPTDVAVGADTVAASVAAAATAATAQLDGRLRFAEAKIAALEATVKALQSGPN